MAKQHGVIIENTTILLHAANGILNLTQ